MSGVGARTNLLFQPERPGLEAVSQYVPLCIARSKTKAMLGFVSKRTVSVVDRSAIQTQRSDLVRFCYMIAERSSTFETVTALSSRSTLHLARVGNVG